MPSSRDFFRLILPFLEAFAKEACTGNYAYPDFAFEKGDVLVLRPSFAVDQAFLLLLASMDNCSVLQLRSDETIASSSLTSQAILSIAFMWS